MTSTKGTHKRGGRRARSAIATPAAMSHSGTFNAATDLVIKLTTTAVLAQNDVIWG